MTLDALKINATFEGKFGTLNCEGEVWSSERQTHGQSVGRPDHLRGGRAGDDAEKKDMSRVDG